MHITGPFRASRKLFYGQLHENAVQCVFLHARYAIAIMIVCFPTLAVIVGSANYVTFASQVNQVKTITVGSSVTTSLAQQQQLINSSFKVISTAGTNLHCQFWNLTFIGNQGQSVVGNFTSDIPLDFYVIQDASYQSWLKVGSCGNGADAITSQLSTMAYSFDVALPSSGRWDLVLVNFSNARDADGFMVAYVPAGSYTSTQQLLSTVTPTSTFTSATTPSTGIPGFPVESIIVGMVTGLVALMILRCRSEKGKVQTS
jgi:hypothetical protein